ncbi:NAD(P)/FAD-dependent oxidoreductase [Pseudoduganella violaceinigra]|uniref:NAD(P)/FAD-dependent oxidoreductase n=1 Tax=Pseudoduganella violaceinigra TaxID=246602 RepID=UPI0003FD1C2A|nr:FAD-dependent oxidoreductase [Pseudoduganella violaceinigra]
MNQTRQRIAVIGAGISGLATAYFLNRHHDVVLFEAGRYLGGHSNTVDVYLEGATCGVDTGFLVYNERTYPNFIELLRELNVPSIASDMSFAVSMENGALEWAGTSLDTLFAQRLRILSPSFLRMVANILHFNRNSRRYLNEAHGKPLSLGELLQENAYGAMFRDAYLLPMAASIWSSTPADILKFPAATFLRFCLNHALLQVNDRPQWCTVRGGSREYVRRIAATLPDCRLDTRVEAIERNAGKATVRTAAGAEVFDAAVLATHAPTSLALLADASAEERDILGGVRYQTNAAWLHTDESLMPRRRKLWSAWNYLSGVEHDGQRPVCVTYWLNQLQSLPLKTPVLVTLNPQQPPAEEKILASFEYEHPVMDQSTIDAQQRLHEIQGRRQVWHAGAWTGYGFHEDGLKSALRVAQAFGAAPDWAVLP